VASAMLEWRAPLIRPPTHDAVPPLVVAFVLDTSTDRPAFSALTHSLVLSFESGLEAGGAVLLGKMRAGREAGGQQAGKKKTGGQATANDLHADT
jgi:hypothetical protein